jgi:hypothetical protein
LGQRGIYFGDEWGLPWNILPGEPCHLPFCQLLNPVCLLALPISNGDNEVRYPGVVIDDVSFRLITCWERDRIPVGVQSSFKVRYLISEGEGSQHVLFLPPVNGGGEALGNVEDGGRVVLVELHHSFSRARGDGSCRSCKGLYSGQRANGCLDQSINSNGRHFLGSIGVMIGAGIVFAEPSMDKSVVGRLIVDPQEEELLGLKVGLELKSDDLEGSSAGGKGF